MVKLVAMYRQPADLDAFSAHYASVHAPLARKLPGLVRLEVSRFTRNAMGGEVPYHLVAEMYFDDMDDLRAAMRSPENAALGRDLVAFAADIVTVLIAEVEIEDEPMPDGRDSHGLDDHD